MADKAPKEFAQSNNHLQLLDILKYSDIHILKIQHK